MKTRSVPVVLRRFAVGLTAVIGFTLFIFSVGLQAGPSFFSVIRHPVR